MVPNSRKIDLWSCPGALWVPSWRQDGPRATPRATFNEKNLILGWPVGSKMEPKSIKNLIKNRLDFYNDFESTFSWSWVDFGSKNLFKMRRLRVTFSTLLRICRKCDFEPPFYGFAIFFDNDVWPSKVYFSLVFSKAILRRTFFKFGSNLGASWSPAPTRSQNWWPNPWKSKLIFWRFFNGF